MGELTEMGLEDKENLAFERELWWDAERLKFEMDAPLTSVGLSFAWASQSIVRLNNLFKFF